MEFATKTNINDLQNQITEGLVGGGQLTFTRCYPSSVEASSSSWTGYFDPPMGNHNCAGFMRLRSSSGNSVYFGSYITATGILSFHQIQGPSTSITVARNTTTGGKIKVTMTSSEGIAYLDVWQLFSND